ncbi:MULTISPECIES: NAD(P)-dependent oxidoreductase [unclassified Luteibacter]|uniref:NAD(P)-dependent oxidoreductase n=1 Tax=unclassified Luteibacter TaxID=2620188 RepID=UPI0008BA30FC|nr:MULTISPECIES: NAD(P)-dependent oxidoreductase [unclassified Luteibacter]SEO30940.1 3-hydroxyisobutyrate dehydrogenase [Luteibacter sp. UNC138MFCol5.1]SEW25738.1 3-hydroxyisobutyrate dehydrogenase [Luteibacter sp. 329MFSha]
MTLKAAFIGLGAMGAPMAGHLHAKGLLAAVGNRTQARADALAGELGVAAPSLAEIAASCDVIALCVSADADVIGVVEALAPSLKAGAIVIDHSTVAPATATKAARLIAEAGGSFLDAPVSGGVEGAKNGKLSVMVGGDADVLDRARPVLEAYGARITHMGKVGSGQATKAVNQVLVAGIAHAVTEGLALGEALGLDADRLIPTLAAGAAGNWFLDKRGATMLRNEFSVGFKLALLHKDLGIVRGIATDAGTDRTIIEQSLADFAELMSQGYGDDDISALIRLKRAS